MDEFHRTNADREYSLYKKNKALSFQFQSVTNEDLAFYGKFLGPFPSGRSVEWFAIRNEKKLKLSSCASSRIFSKKASIQLRGVDLLRISHDPLNRLLSLSRLTLLLRRRDKTSNEISAYSLISVHVDR